jgi:hypothetical protein
MPEDIHSFLVRVWSEAVEGGDHVDAWRGSIERVGDGQRFYFHELEGIPDLIQELVGPRNVASKESSQTE